MHPRQSRGCMADFFDSLNRELAGHLRTAEDLYGRAVKWRADFDAWAKGRGNFKPEASWEVSAGAGVGVDIAAQVPEMPSQLKSTFTKIWDGLCGLPGAVKKGIEGKKDDMAKGLEFGFRAAGVVMEETAELVIKDVVKSALSKIGSGVTKFAIKKLLRKRIGELSAERLYKISDVTLDHVEMVAVAMGIWPDRDEFVDRGRKIGQKIKIIRNEMYGTDNGNLKK